MIPDISRDILSDIIIFMKYARYDDKKGRRETWEEIVDRNKAMHIKKFPKLKEEIEEIFEYIYSKKILPSMRFLQFAGKPAELNNARIYNCSAVAFDHIDVFKEVFFLLLSGCGVGISVQNHHVSQLPEIQKPIKKRRYLIGDSIENWADSVGILMDSYFGLRKSEPVFDFNDIRPKGTPLKTSGGIAPGPEPLKTCLHQIKTILDRKQNGEKLTTLEVHDIACYIANAVLSGGIRRCLAKDSWVVEKSTGIKKIQNINVGDLVSTPSGWKRVIEKFAQGKQLTVVIKHKNGSLNCTPNHKVAVLTDLNKYDWKLAKDIKPKDRLCFFYNESNNKIPALPEHVYFKSFHVHNLKDIKIPDLDEGIAWLIGLVHGDGYVDLDGCIRIVAACKDVEILKRAKNEFLKFGLTAVIKKRKEANAYSLFVFSRQLARYFYKNFKQPNTCLEVPECIKGSNKSIILAYIKGAMDADGSICNNHIQVVASVYPSYVIELQNLLYSCGIASRIHSSKPRNGWKPCFTLVLVNRIDKLNFLKQGGAWYKQFELPKKFNNSDGYLEQDAVRFIKNKQIRNSLGSKSKQVSYDTCLGLTKANIIKPVEVVEIIKGEVVETYDIEVEEDNCFMCEGVLVHNSSILSLFSFDDVDMKTAKYNNDWQQKEFQRALSNNSAVMLRHKIKQEDFDSYFDLAQASGFGEPGFFFSNDKDYLLNPCSEISLKSCGFCNLVTINTTDIKTQEDFNKRCLLASRLATLQGSYTDFHYLRTIWKENAEKEALIGVSLAGIVSGNVLNLNLKEGAQIVKQENKKFSSILGINPAYRTTTVKPEGTTSLVLGCSSGIHSFYSEFYIRRIRVTKEESIYKYFNQYHPELLEDDHFKPETQSIISVPIKIPEGAMTRSETALQFLERVKKVFINWIKPGHNRGSNYNNTSCTVNVRENEWDRVKRWMWDNKNNFTAISVLPYDNSKYKQAPFEEITEGQYNQMIKKLKKIDLTKVKEDGDYTQLKENMACVGSSACEVT